DVFLAAKRIDRDLHATISDALCETLPGRPADEHGVDVARNRWLPRPVGIERAGDETRQRVGYFGEIRHQLPVDLLPLREDVAFAARMRFALTVPLRRMTPCASRICLPMLPSPLRRAISFSTRFASRAKLAALL